MLFLKTLAGAVLIAAASSNACALEIATGYQPGLTALPLMVMDAEQLVTKEAKARGIDVTARFIDMGNPTAVNDALLAGRLQFAVVAPGSLAVLWSKSKASDQVRAAAALAQMPSFLMTKDPSITTIRDYTQGHRIALPSPKVSIQAIYLEMAAAREFGHAQFAKLDTLTLPMTHTDGLTAMLSPQIEVTSQFTSPPFQYQALRSGKGAIRRILSSYDVLGGKSTFTLIATTTRFVTEHADAYAAYLSALEKAMAQIKADKRTYAELYLKVTKSKEPVEVVLEMLNDPDIDFSTTPLNVKQIVDFMASVGTIKEKPGSWRDLTFPNLHAANGS
jgi:NitT/TauT family transport system substrate-binding protein